MLYSLGKIKPQLQGEGHFIAPSAAVIGNVILGSQVSVWFSVGDPNAIAAASRASVASKVIFVARTL